MSDQKETETKINKYYDYLVTNFNNKRIASHKNMYELSLTYKDNKNGVDEALDKFTAELAAVNFEIKTINKNENDFYHCPDPIYGLDITVGHKNYVLPVPFKTTFMDSVMQYFYN